GVRRAVLRPATAATAGDAGADHGRAAADGRCADHDARTGRRLPDATAAGRPIPAGILAGRLPAAARPELRPQLPGLRPGRRLRFAAPLALPRAGLRAALRPAGLPAAGGLRAA